MVKDLHGWMMSRANIVKVHSFSGATTTDMTHHLKPLFRKKSDHIILHAGTNDLCETWMTPQDIANNVFNLVKTINSEGIKCSVSGVIRRDDELSEKGQQVNSYLKGLLPAQCMLIDNNNLSLSHLNKSGLHLNRRGSGAFARNLITHIRNLDQKSQR